MFAYLGGALLHPRECATLTVMCLKYAQASLSMRDGVRLFTVILAPKSVIAPLPILLTGGIKASPGDASRLRWRVPLILGTPSAERGKALEGADAQVCTPYQSL
jgi:hypothetical protein